MSERGIEIHNGSIIFPEGSPPELHMGTNASPLTQGVASQIVISAVINALALGGTVVAGLFKAIASVNFTGALRGLRIGTTITDGITVTGSSYGIHLELEVLGTGVVTGSWEGIRIELYNTAGTTLSSDVYGLFINNYQLGTITGSYHMVRLEENGTMIVDSVFFVGVTDAVNFLTLRPQTPSAGGWDLTTDVTNTGAYASNGYLRVATEIGVRRIPLYL